MQNQAGGSRPLRFGLLGGQPGTKPGFVSRQGHGELRRRSGLSAQFLKEGQPALVTKRHQSLGFAAEEAEASPLNALRQGGAN